MVTSDDLIRGSQDGSVEAFEELVRRHERSVYNLAYRIMGNHSDASDAAQEALLKVYMRLPNFRGDAAFTTWLYRIVTNACLDELRRLGRNRHTSLNQPHSVADGTLEHQLPDNQEGPAAVAERHDLQRDVQQAINQLRSDYRVLLVLRDLKGISYREVCEVTGQTVGIVKSRLHRARRALRHVLTVGPLSQ